MKRYIPLLILLITGCTNTPINNEIININKEPVIAETEPPYSGYCLSMVGDICDPISVDPISLSQQRIFTVNVLDEYHNSILGAEVKVKITNQTDKLIPYEENVTYNGSGYTFTKIFENGDENKEYKLDITASKDNWKMYKSLNINFKAENNNISFYKFTNKIAYSSINKTTNISEINVISSEDVGTKKVSEDGVTRTKLSDIEVNSIKPVWSPDGNKIAYIGQINGENNLFVVNADGTDRKKVYSNIKDSWVSWSADSKKILFESNISSNKQNQIFTVDNDGTNLRNLTNLSENNHNPQWSADGTKIVYVEEKDNKSNITLMNPDGSNKNIINTKDGYGNFNFPQWSPDNKKIMYIDSNNRIKVMNADGTDEKLVISNCDGIPRWSPDSKKIVFSLSLSAINQNKKTDIYTINPDGTNRYQLSNNNSFNSFPDFSADGKSISYINSNKMYVINSENNTSNTYNSYDKFEADYITVSKK